MKDLTLSEALTLIKANRPQRYVYGLLRPDTREPFYVGEGQASRISQHLLKSRFGRNWKKADLIRHYLARGEAIRFRIFGFYDTREECIAAERKLIAQYGRDIDGGILTNLKDGEIGVLRHDASTKARISEAARRMWADPLVREKLLAARAKANATAEVKQRRRQAQLGKKQSADTVAKRTASTVGVKRPTHVREAVAESVRQKWADPNWREAHRQRLSDAQRKAWSEGKYRRDFTAEHCDNLSIAGRRRYGSVDTPPPTMLQLKE